MKERDWDTLHKWETKEKARFLENLTIQKGFIIFQNLYNTAQRVKGKRNTGNQNLEKIKTLVKIRSVFRNLDS